MPQEHGSILGISASTRSIGFAVIRNGELVDWRMKLFKQLWSKKKLESMISFLSRLMESNSISVLSVKIQRSSSRSKNIQYLLSGIKELASEKNVSFQAYSLRDLKNYCKAQGTDTIADLIRYIVHRNPQLAVEYEKECSNRNSYYVKMFEAIIAGMITRNAMENY